MINDAIFIKQKQAVKEGEGDTQRHTDRQNADRKHSTQLRFLLRYGNCQKDRDSKTDTEDG